MANVTFERERAATHAEAMIAWFLGVAAETAGRVSDYNAGSNIRTLLESVAIRLEHLDSKAFMGIRRAIPVMLFEVFGEGDGVTSFVGFPSLPALPATGVLRFVRAPAAVGDILIPAGARASAAAVAGRTPITYATVVDALMPAAQSTLDVVVAANTPGVIGNAQANTVSLLDVVTGIVSANNPAALVGREAETVEARQARFTAYLRNLARAQFAGLEAGALTAVRLLSGAIVERVVAARATAVPGKLGLVDVFVDNGGATATVELVAEVQRVLDGYLATDGTRVHGYKAAGITVRAQAVLPQPVDVVVQVRIDPSYRAMEVLAGVTDAVFEYVTSLAVFADLVRTELAAVVATVPGVVDHLLVAPTANVTASRGGRVQLGTFAVEENSAL